MTDTGSIIPSWARVGAKVVCIQPETDNQFPGQPEPQVGTTYTITRVGRVYGFLEPIISLAELVAFDPHEGELGFDVRCFRPLVTRSLEADVSRFRKHLRVKRNKADAVVRIPHLGTIGK